MTAETMCWFRTRRRIYEAGDLDVGVVLVAGARRDVYRQLIDALEGEQGAGANGVAKSRPPFWCDAADKKFDFDLIVEFNLPDYSTRGSITARLIALAHHAWTVDQIRSVRRIAGILNAWADDFEALLTHGHVLRLTAACPACGEETVHRYDSGGELIRDTALIATEAGAVCQSCEHRWGPSEYSGGQRAQLARQFDEFSNSHSLT